MIDLHVHTKYSDGTNDVIEILKKAHEKNLKYISITDHNTCMAYEELKILDISKYYTGKIIKGVELNTKILGIPIEVLGYGIDTNFMNEKLPQMYLSTEERNKVELERIFSKCLEADINVGENFIENYNPKVYVSKYLHGVITQDEKNKKIIDEESWNNSNIFYRKFMSNPNTVFFVNIDDIIPDFETVAKLIKQAGGLLFIPHIYEYRDNATKILKYIIKNYEIDGIECYYTTFTNEQNKRIIGTL